MRLIAAMGFLLAVMGIAAQAEVKSRPAATAAERGREVLLRKPLTPAIWSLPAYENAWKQWGVAEKPANYAEAFAERYGLHAAPFEGVSLPMGMQEAPGLVGKGLTNTCLLCHGGSILGKSYVGLGNVALDMQLLYEELMAAEGRRYVSPFPFSNVRGTTEAGAMAIYLLRIRNEELQVKPPVDLQYRTDLCEDPPAWWLLKRKQTMYHTGSTPARSVRSLMQFALSPFTPIQQFKEMEPDFADLQAYVLSLEPPPYPYPVDEALAKHGAAIFSKTCATCHGTYGHKLAYPNKIIDLDVIGTDPTRAEGFGQNAVTHYNTTWFGKEKGPGGEAYQAELHHGYQGPPLDGVWATAPYFHNGSVPTLYHVLNSKSRPEVFTRSFKTNEADFDRQLNGWKVKEAAAPGADVPAPERRKVYDTTQPGRGNQGHTFGDKLSDEERMAVIEYLKTL